MASTVKGSSSGSSTVSLSRRDNHRIQVGFYHAPQNTAQRQHDNGNSDDVAETNGDIVFTDHVVSE